MGRLTRVRAWLLVPLVGLVFLTGCSLVIINRSPVAVFTTQQGTEPMTFVFDATGSYDPDGIIVSYIWTMGDGHVRYGAVVTHTFWSPGSYNVHLTVEDKEGAKGFAGGQLSVAGPSLEDKIRNAIDWWEPVTRNFAVTRIAQEHSGPYNIAQICDLWDYCRRWEDNGHWVYVSDPSFAEYTAKASETILVGLRGDCDDYAVLNAALIVAIGGTARVVVEVKPDGSAHAYAEVYLGRTGATRHLTDCIYRRYPQAREVWVYPDPDGKVWLNLDWQDCYPGGKYWGGRRVMVVYPHRTARRLSVPSAEILYNGILHR